MSDEGKKYYACETNPFVDVKDDIAIAVLAKAKIILGYDEHYWKCQEMCSRETPKI